ncbi:hypothetical protein AAHH17_16355 [Lysinibacillus capsici]|uniref:hypothetical protein n=1 Tax=Lysinibacillus capsici TaxID=2115968 RepID=UPI0032E4E89F
METASIILSILASIGTLVSLYLNHNLKKEIATLKQEISGNNNIQSQGNNVINNTGDSSTFIR